jgi:hypothetical protein
MWIRMITIIERVGSDGIKARKRYRTAGPATAIVLKMMTFVVSVRPLKFIE